MFTPKCWNSKQEYRRLIQYSFMTQGKFTPKNGTQKFTKSSETFSIAVQKGRGIYESPLGPIDIDAVCVEMEHNPTGNHHGLILSMDGAKELVQLLNAVISQ